MKKQKERMQGNPYEYFNRLQPTLRVVRQFIAQGLDINHSQDGAFSMFQSVVCFGADGVDNSDIDIASMLKPMLDYATPDPVALQEASLDISRAGWPISLGLLIDAGAILTEEHLHAAQNYYFNMVKRVETIDLIQSNICTPPCVKAADF